MLAIMSETGQPFSRFALVKSAEHAKCFNGIKPDEVFTKQFDEMAKQSQAKQAELENRVQLPFDDFLNQYFAQQ
jgi:glutamate--cysteine ligase